MNAHDVLELLNDYRGMDIWGELIIPTIGFNYEKTEAVDPNGILSDRFVTKRGDFIIWNEAKNMWIQADHP